MTKKKKPEEPANQTLPWWIRWLPGPMLIPQDTVTVAYGPIPYELTPTLYGPSPTPTWYGPDPNPPQWYGPSPQQPPWPFEPVPTQNPLQPILDELKKTNERLDKLERQRKRPRRK